MHDRHQRRNHGLGRAAADRDLAFRIDLDALPQLHLPGNRVAQALGAPGDGVLIDVGRNRFLRRALDLRRRRKIGKALRQVDGAVQHGLTRHFADDRLGEVRDPAAKKGLLLDGCFCHKDQPSTTAKKAAEAMFHAKPTSPAKLPLPIQLKRGTLKIAAQIQLNAVAHPPRARGACRGSGTALPSIQLSLYSAS